MDSKNPSFLAPDMRGYKDNTFFIFHKNICCGFPLEAP